MSSHQASARVVRLDGGRIWIETLPESGCAACATGSGCGALRWRSRRPAVFAVPAPTNGQAAVGDTVLVEIPDGALLLGALAQYLAPLAGMFAGAIALSLPGAQPSDFAIGLGATAGLLAGLFAARVLAARLARRGWFATRVRRADGPRQDGVNLQLT